MIISIEKKKRIVNQLLFIVFLLLIISFQSIDWSWKKKAIFLALKRENERRKKKREPGVLEKREKSFSRNNHQSILENLSYTNVCLIDQHNDINWNSIDCSYTEILSSISSNANYSHTYNSTSYIHCCLYWFDNQYGDNCTSLSKFCHK